MLSPKYRPNTLSEFCGNRDVVEFIKNALEHMKKTKLPQNFLFYGQVGVGKTSLAYIVKNELGVDDHDFMEINASKMKKFKDIGGFTEIIMMGRFYGSLNSPFKIVLIDDAEFLSEREQRELGNIMDEYSKFAMFILVTNAVDKIKNQLRSSRCICFELKPIQPDDMISRLKLIAKNEGIEVSDNEIKIIAKLAKGDLRDAIERLPSSSSNRIFPIEKLLTFKNKGLD